MNDFKSSLVDANSRNLLSASVAAVAVLGASTLAYSVVQSRAQKRKAQEIFNSKAASRKTRRGSNGGADDDIAPFLRK